MKTVIEMAQQVEAEGFAPVNIWPEVRRLCELVRADERARMAEQPAQQEPVGYFGVNDYGRWEENENEQGQPFYTSPPAQRTWVGLTDCEREKLRSEADEADAGYRKLIKATEAKLKEKNT